MKGLGKVRVGAALAASGAVLDVRGHGAGAAARRPSATAHPSGRAASSSTTSAAISATAPGEITCPAPPAASDAALRRAAGADDERRAAWSACSSSCRRAGSRTSSSTATRATRSRAPTPRRRTTPPACRRCARSATSTACASRGRHGNLTEANWDNQIAASKILGQDHIGESGFPGGVGAYNTYQQALNTAAAAQPARQALRGGRPRPGVLPQPPAGVPDAPHGQRRAQERVGDRDGAHRPALGRRADRHRLGRLRRRRAPEPGRSGVGQAVRDGDDQEVPQPDRVLPRQGHGQHPPDVRQRRSA